MKKEENLKLKILLGVAAVATLCAVAFLAVVLTPCLTLRLKTLPEANGTHMNTEEALHKKLNIRRSRRGALA